jgi:hypothetical protein
MMFRPLLAALVLFPLLVLAEAPPPMVGLPLVEEVLCGETAPGTEFPQGVSKVEALLGKKARVLPNDAGGIKFVAYKLGAGKGLQAGKAYVLEVEYPEDAPRTWIIQNRGAEYSRGFHTGVTIGDCLTPRYVQNNPESLNLPLSGRYEKWQTLFHLHDRFAGLQVPRDQEYARDMVPADGFWVVVAQFEPAQGPRSRGAAVSAIRLYEAPPLETYALPPRLPRYPRHLFWREEMADNVVGGKENQRGVKNPSDWFEYKARLHKFLGMNTFSKDLLEFGANQGWDSAKFGGNAWVHQSHDPQRWHRIVEIATKYGLELMPYYEYSGSKGDQGLGYQKRAVPLGTDKYTHIPWTETARADLTDPETFEDFRKMLEITVVDEKKAGKFAGIWLRPRSSQLPVSFSDAALERFGKETSTTATREALKTDKALYAKYMDWWFGKRRDFLNKARDYLRENSGNPGAVVLYTPDVAEAGRPFPTPSKLKLVAEDPAGWAPAGIPALSLREALEQHRQLVALTSPTPTWAQWEWQHAVPEYDPKRYQGNEGVLPTFSFNRAYTVGDASALEAFRTKSGLAMVRHYTLNENMFRESDDKNPNDPLGYFVTDVEAAGPFCMLAEARAVAHGDPAYIGYLSSSSFNRGFPNYVRAFNQAYLSLPALPSTLLDDGSKDPEVVVRRIDAGSDGVYYAVVNTGYTEKRQAGLRLRNGTYENAVNPAQRWTATEGLKVDLYPCQLLVLKEGR